MATIALEDFIGEYRAELIRRCEVKVAARTDAPEKVKSDHGVPLFLDQLCEQLRDRGSQSDDIGETAKKHGHDLLLQGFTIEQVVHDYGDVCQSVTDLAVEVEAPISTDDFRTLNRCLDNAIAGAVTEFTAKKGMTQRKESVELHQLIDAALAAFQVIREGNVGVRGNTAAVVERSLIAIRTHLTTARSGAKTDRRA
jgi:hypothetical protein